MLVTVQDCNRINRGLFFSNGIILFSVCQQIRRHRRVSTFCVRLEMAVTGWSLLSWRWMRISISKDDKMLWGQGGPGWSSQWRSTCRREEVATPPPGQRQVRTSADTNKPRSSYNILVSPVCRKSSLCSSPMPDDQSHCLLLNVCNSSIDVFEEKLIS